MQERFGVNQAMRDAMDREHAHQILNGKDTDLNKGKGRGNGGGESFWYCLYDMCVRHIEVLSAYRDGFDPKELPVRGRVTNHSRAIGVWAGCTGRSATRRWLIFKSWHGGKDEGKTRDDNGGTHEHCDDLGEGAEGWVVKG